MVAEPGNSGSGVGVVKLYCQACGIEEPVPVPIGCEPMMAEIWVAVGGPGEPAEGLRVP